MGFFSRLFGNKKLSPEDLRAALFNAAAVDDAAKVEALCQGHRDEVLAQFPDWQRVPPEIRNQPQRIQWYGQGLVAVAQCFAARLGDPSLIARLMGPPADNPLRNWQDALAQADALIEAGELVEARTLLEQQLTKVSDLQGTGVDSLLPITRGKLALCRFHLGAAAEAVPLLEQALADCERTGDHDGVRAYLSSLYEAHRYLGHAVVASGYASRLATVFESQQDRERARHYRRQAELAAAGEPACRVVAVAGDRRFELDELPGLVGERVQFVFERNRVPLRPASDLIARGEELGADGDYEGALARFRAAAAADPWDPHCRYQAAFTLLHLRRYAEAEAEYAEVERLAPGWFHCRSDRWLAGQLAAGAVDHAVFVAVHTVQDSTMPAEDKLQLADAALQHAPRLALLHLLRAKQLSALGRPQEAIAALRTGLGCEPDPDVRARLNLDLGAALDDSQERERALLAAQDPGGNLVAAAMARLVLAANAHTRAN